jgi:hypothetical protein
VSKFVQHYIVLLCSLLALPSWASDRPFIDEPDNRIREDFHESEWKEADLALPKHYEEENLQEFHLDQASGRFRFFIDRASLQTTSDGVSRFLLVIRSENGAENTSYEGLRCGKRIYKVYAYGSGHGLQPVASANWQRISKSGRDNYRNALYSNLLCNLSTGKPNSPKVVFRAMQRHSTVQPFPFSQN